MWGVLLYQFTVNSCSGCAIVNSLLVACRPTVDRQVVEGSHNYRKLCPFCDRRPFRIVFFFSNVPYRLPLIIANEPLVVGSFPLLMRKRSEFQAKYSLFVDVSAGCYMVTKIMIKWQQIQSYAVFVILLALFSPKQKAYHHHFFLPSILLCKFRFTVSISDPWMTRDATICVPIHGDSPFLNYLPL